MKLNILLITISLIILFQATVVLAANTSSFSQTIVDGTQGVDIVDATGNPVSSSSVTFGGLTFSFNSQNAIGTLGNSSQKIRVFNPTSDVTWTVSIAATDGPTALWTSGTESYDFNDGNTSGTDDLDVDTRGGKLTVDPSVALISGVPDNIICSPLTGITKGSTASFQEVSPAINSITLLTGGAFAKPYCRWDLTGVSLNQLIPGVQPSGTYNMSFTVTIV